MATNHGIYFQDTLEALPDVTSETDVRGEKPANTIHIKLEPRRRIPKHILCDMYVV